MIPLSLSLLIVASNVGVHIAQAQNAPPESVRAVVESFERAASGQSVRVVMTSSAAVQCSPEQEARCVEEVRRAIQTDDVVLLGIAASGNQATVTARRFAPSGSATASADVMLDDAAKIDEAMKTLVARLLVDSTRSSETVAMAEAPRTPEPPTEPPAAPKAAPAPASSGALVASTSTTNKIEIHSPIPAFVVGGSGAVLAIAGLAVLAHIGSTTPVDTTYGRGEVMHDQITTQPSGSPAGWALLGSGLVAIAAGVMLYLVSDAKLSL